MTVYYTSNELRSQIPRLLEVGQVQSQRYELKVGDYFCGSISANGSFVGVPVERKYIWDYFASIKDGRRDEQLYHLSYNFPLSYIVLIGSPSVALRETKVSVNAYVSSLVGASLKRAADGACGQVITVNLENDTQFVIFLRYLDAKVREGDFARVPIMQKQSWKPEELLIYVISSLPGVGTKTAHNLLNHFGSVRAIMNATKEQLMEVDGIGQKKADEIHTVMTMAYTLQEMSV